MKRFVAGLCALVALGGIGLMVYTYTASNNNPIYTDTVTPKPAPASVKPSPMPNKATPEPAITDARSGTFYSTPGETVTGTVSITELNGKYYVQLGSDFTTTPGPDLYVGFGNNEKIDLGSLISALKAENGAQSYELPAGFDTTVYNQVFIYCKQYAHTYGIADLR